MKNVFFLFFDQTVCALKASFLQIEMESNFMCSKLLGNLTIYKLAIKISKKLVLNNPISLCLCRCVFLTAKVSL